MYEQEPTVNDILSSIRQILSNKIEDNNSEGVSANTVNAPTVNPVDEQEQALMQATDVYILKPDMRVEQENKRGSVEPTTSASHNFSYNAVSNDMPYEQPVVFDAQMNVENTTVSNIQSQTDISQNMPHVQAEDVKPFIQEWLDKNLPDLVERIVTEEVRRIFNKR